MPSTIQQELPHFKKTNTGQKQTIATTLAQKEKNSTKEEAKE